MKRILATALVAFVGVACAPVASNSTRVTAAEAEEKGTAVDFDGQKSKVPAEWKEEDPGRMRYAQFKLPRAQGDEADAEVVIFKGITGSPKDNVERWKNMFVPPEGKKLDDVAKISEVKVGGRQALRIDVEGTYKFKARPFDPSAKEELKPNFKLTGLHIEGPKNIYHIRFVGPAKTVDKYKAGFEEWLKGFKD